MYKLITYLVLLTSIIGTVVQAVTTVTLTSSNANLREYAGIQATVSTTGTISRTQSFSFAVSSKQFTKDIRCGSISTTLTGTTYAAGASLDISKKNNEYRVSGTLDLDAAQSSTSEAFDIYCSIPVHKDAVVNSIQTVTFSIDNVDATGSIAIGNSGCSEEIEFKLEKNNKTVLKFKKSRLDTNYLFIKAPTSLVSISYSNKQTCSLKVKGDYQGDVSYNVVDAANGVALTLPEVVSSGKDYEITCENSGLIFSKASNVPTIATIQCSDTNTDEDPRLSYSFMNSSSLISVLSACVVLATAISAMYF